MYNPRIIMNHVQTPLYKRPYNPEILRPVSALPNLNKPAITQEDIEFNPDKLHKYTTGYVLLAKKTARKPLNELEGKQDPDGKQFEVREIPRVSSKYRYETIT